MWRTNLNRWQTAVGALSQLFALAPATSERRGLSTGRKRSRLAAVRRSEAVQRASEWLHGLYLYGALGISTFGSAICAVFGWDHSQWVPYWFFGALLVYNIDRLRPDPADVINLPKRRAISSRLRGVSAALAIASAVALLWLPLRAQDWISLGLVLSGALLCVSYSVPIFGARLKQLPMLKTFFAPSLVVLAILSMPLAHGFWPAHFGLLIFAAVWAWGYLLCNMLLCDIRDLKGDRRTGVISVPVRLGRKAAYRLLWILIACTGGMATLLAAFPGSASRLIWLGWAFLGSLYIGGLATAVMRRRSERFYEWWVEGMLFVPAVVVVIFR